MDNADKLAPPTSSELNKVFDNSLGEMMWLTKREYFAGLAMARMIEPACIEFTEIQMDDYCRHISWRANKIADAMLEES